jgi:rubrerythrin
MQTQNLTDILPLDELEPTGQLAEVAEEAGASRADFLRRGAAGGLGLAAGSSLLASFPALASAKGLPKSDKAILNFALLLEHLEADFYGLAVSKGGLKGKAHKYATIIHGHEQTHVKTLKSVLGKSAQKPPKFHFDSSYKSGKFGATAFALENTGVHAYLGQAGNIKTPKILLAAATIVTTEARHAAAIGELIGKSITPSGAFDVGYSKTKVTNIVKSKGFLG